MVTKSGRGPTPHHSSKSLISDGDGNQIHNEILLSLPPVEIAMVLPKLELLRLNVRHILHEPGDTLRSAYFVNHGMVSILSVLPNGSSVEVGLVGKEGFVGSPLLAGFRSAATRANVQIQATAFRLNASDLSTVLHCCPVLERKLHQVGQVATMEATQIAACNRLHEVQQRLARWLLMCVERVGQTKIPLTQELLGQMLGTRRSSVTIGAGSLQKAGVIRYSHGTVDIMSIQKLEKSSCECYEVMQRQKQRWRQEDSEIGVF